jgi:PAS domain S-box-containing protein
MSIRTKLLILFLSITFISLAFLGAANFYMTKGSLFQTALNFLHVVSEIREGEVLFNLSRLKARTQDFASDGFIAESLEGGIREGNLNEYLLRRKKVLEENLIFIDILDLLGKVVASTIPARVGLDKSAKKHFINGKDSVYIGDIHREEDGTVEMEIAAPLKKYGHSKTIGILVNHFNVAMMDRIMTGSLELDVSARTRGARIGRTGETYLVNQDGIIMTNSVFVENAAFRQHVDTYPVNKCLQEGAEVVGKWLNYRGVPVVGSSMCISVSDFKWTLVAEQGEDEAIGQIVRIKNRLILLGAIVLFIVTLLVAATAKIISDPICALHKGSEIIGQGNLDYKVGTNERDEIGQLSRAFDQMTEKLKKTMVSRYALDQEMLGKKDTEKQLRQSEEKYRNLVDNALAGVFSTSLYGQILYVNDAMAEMMEFDSPEEMKKTMAVIRYENPNDREAVIARLKESGMVYNHELDVLTKSGKSKKILLSAFLDNNSVISGMVVDVSERQQAQAELARRVQELARVNEELDRFNQLGIGRELRIVELKGQINELSRQAGKEPPYDLSFKDADS